MKKSKKLAEAEWQIMNSVWQFEKPVTVREVHQRFFSKGEKAYTTVQTIMNILVNKRFLKKEKIGMVNFYRPIVSKERFGKHETLNLVSRIFKGSFGELANYLVQSGGLSENELMKLKAAIRVKEKERKSGEK